MAGKEEKDSKKQKQLFLRNPILDVLRRVCDVDEDQRCEH
jgi:hypothetical protein